MTSRRKAGRPDRARAQPMQDEERPTRGLLLCGLGGDEELLWGLRMCRLLFSFFFLFVLLARVYGLLRH